MVTVNPERDLSFASTISRHIVHRAAICEVFLTDSIQVEDGQFMLAAQLPRVHSYYNDHDSVRKMNDPLLLTEAARQAAIAVAHQYVGAPADSKFIYNMSEMRIQNVDALIIGDRPGCLVLDAVITSTKERHGVVVGIGLGITLTLDGETVGSTDILFQWMPPAAWDSLRARGRSLLNLQADRSASPDTRLPAAHVGRMLTSNVVLGQYVTKEQGLVADVLVDRDHPAIFDHPLDHIPGMLQFEAMRQAGTLAAGVLLARDPGELYMARCRARFTRFGEFELPTAAHARLLPAQAPGGAALAVDIMQDDEIIAGGEVELVSIRQSGEG